MLDKELADKVVAQFVGVRSIGRKPDYYTIDYDDLDPEEFVRDPRVAMALLDRLSHTMVLKVSTIDSAAFVDIIEYSPNGDEEALPIGWSAHDINTARAINEVCCEALS